MDIIERFVDFFQIFKNGMGHFCKIRSGNFGGDYSVRKLPRDVERTEWTQVHEKACGDRVSYSYEKTNHCYFEATSNIMDGINEMLLHSYDQTIRVFPAVEDGFSGMFRLAAVGGFMVSSEMINGCVRYIVIESEHGGKCSVVNPWGARVRINDVEFGAMDILGFDAAAGETYLIELCENCLDQYYVDTLTGEEERQRKGVSERSTWIGKELLGEFKKTEFQNKRSHHKWLLLFWGRFNRENN